MTTIAGAPRACGPRHPICAARRTPYTLGTAGPEMGSTAAPAGGRHGNPKWPAEWQRRHVAPHELVRDEYKADEGA
jgi:hypothetical protein